MEENVNFISENNLIEGLISKQSVDKAVIITHPHPLYGGDMYNSVVETICSVYQGLSYTTLRFNFRGVGNSQGSHDNGKGEQEDVKSAIAFLHNSGFKQIDLAGYSYGAWILALVSIKLVSRNDLVLVSPPIDFIDFQNVKKLTQLKYVIAGSNDNFADAGKLKKTVNGWNSDCKFELINGSDHFFSGHLDNLKNTLISAL